MTQSGDGSAQAFAGAYTAIQNLYARYNWCSDAGDADGYAACFTEDGELSLPGVGLHIQGRESLREFKRQDKARRGDRIRRHWNSGLWLEAVGEHTMRGRCYLHGYDGTPGEAPVLSDIGAYEDMIVHREGEWRFAKRVITMDHSAFRPPPPVVRSEALDQDITSLSAARIARAVAERKLSAREATEAMLARVDNLNPTLNAICTLNDAALDEADAVDRRLAGGGAPRPLEGVPVVVKDNIFTKGIRTTFGSKILEHDVPEEDSICVERLRGAGAVVLGKANTPEFAHDVNTTNPVFGTTRNPWNVNHTAGGSSGGTGSAVAGRLAPAGLGTDLGGSIRIPSSFNGLAGIRPAPGRVAFYPTEFGWDTLVAHVQGPMARTVEDVGLVLDVLAGPDDRDPMSLPAQGLDFTAAARGPADPADLAGTRLALSIDLGGLVPVEPEVEALVRRAAQDLEALGCEVSETFFDNSSLAEIIFGTRGFGMIARYTERYARHRDVMTPPPRSG